MRILSVHLENTSLSIDSIHVCGKTFFIAKRRDLLFVGTTNNGTKLKKVQKERESLASDFLEAFPEMMFCDFSGDITPFLKFGEKFCQDKDGFLKKVLKGIF